MAITLNHDADRFTPFYWRMYYRGIDLTLAGFHMHIRTKFDVPGAPVASLDVVGVEHTLGIYRHPLTMEGDVPISRVDVFIPRAAMIAMPPAPVLGGIAPLVYDLHVEAVGEPEFNIFRGAFNIIPGATQHA